MTYLNDRSQFYLSSKLVCLSISGINHINTDNTETANVKSTGTNLEAIRQIGRTGSATNLLAKTF